jgi:hypothetical protein
MTLILSGTNGVSDIDGSAATPAIRGTDTNTGIFFPATDTIAFAEGGVESMRIDSSGNVGIGTSSPSGRLNLAVGASTSCTMRFTANNTGTGAGDRGRLDFYSADNSGVAYQLGYMDYDRADGTGTASYIAWASRVSGTVAERMRIDSSGNLLVGRTSTGGTAAVSVERPANTATYIYQMKSGQVECTWGFKASTDSNMYIGSGSTSVGTYGVYLTNTGNSWNAVSDERMKTILEPIENASEKVSSLRAVIGYYNNDESQIRRPFLIAQDVQKVLPEAVNVQDIETGTLGMSYTDTIPLLVAAIKEQQALITALTARIEALENK